MALSTVLDLTVAFNRPTRIGHLSRSPWPTAPSRPVRILGVKVDVVAKHESWFSPKRVGVGWGPRTWQGWLIVALFTGVVADFAIFESVNNIR